MCMQRICLVCLCLCLCLWYEYGYVGVLDVRARLSFQTWLKFYLHHFPDSAFRFFSILNVKSVYNSNADDDEDDDDDNDDNDSDNGNGSNNK